MGALNASFGFWKWSIRTHASMSFWNGSGWLRLKDVHDLCPSRVEKSIVSEPEEW